MPTQSFKVGEMLNKRTPNSKTWINFDGSYTTEIHMGPVHFDDEHGNLHNINTDLFDEADFDVIDEPVSREINGRFKQAKLEAKKAKEQRVLNRDNHNFQALRVPFDCHIPRNFQRGYTIGKGKDKITFKPVKSSPAKGYINDSDRSIITYQDVWNDTDVQLQVQTNGLKETILLKTDRAPSSFSFEVKGKEIAEDFTAGALKLMPAWLRDAKGTERDVKMVVTTKNDNKVYVELNADVTDLVYPIEIDPTVVIQPDGASGKDTYADSGQPTSNFGGAGYVSIGAWNDRGIGFFQFDYSQIPDNALITQAEFSAHYSGVWNVGNNGNAYFGVYKVLDAWEENTLTYNNIPEIGTSFYSETLLPYNANFGVYAWDVTNLCNEHIQGTSPNNGFALKLTGSTSGYFGANLYSSDSSSSNKPKLSITYNTPPTAPTIFTPNGGETWNSLHTIEFEGGVDAEELVLDISIDKYETNWGNANYYAGQSITIPEGATKLLGVSLRIDSATNGNPMEIEITDSNYNVIHSEVKYFTVSSGVQKITLSSPINVTTGQLIVVFFKQYGSSYSIKYTQAGEYTGGNMIYDNGSFTHLANSDISMMAHFEKPNYNLQHQIQLSTDLARTDWRNIVGLTAPGVTTYDYDFINEPETSVALVRARAYDGTSYGPWDESDGVFTIQHNQAPTAPTNLSPSGGQPVDRAQPVRASWLHNDPDNSDPQSKFDLRWRLQGNTTWNTISQVTINQFYDLINLPYGNIEWQVRTYDQAGLSSPYSAIEVFLAGDKPVAPTIVSPGANVSVANPTVQWSSVDQVGYKLRVLDDVGTEVYNHTGGTNKAHTIQYDLANQSDYTIETSISNADGLESDVDNLLITVSYTPPARAQVVTSSNSDNASIALDITNPVPSGTEPVVSHNNIYRRVQGEAEFIRIATNIAPNTSYIDNTPASGKQYEYQVRAWGDNGTYSDSDVVSESVAFKHVRLSLASDPSESVQLKYNGERSFDVNFKHSTKQFAGRKRPVTTFSEIVNNDLRLSYLVDPNDYESLQEMLFKREVMIYRDLRGRKYFVTAGAFSVSDELVFEYYEVNLPLNEVDHSEVV